MNPFPPLPNLPTLHERPSWVSWSGRVDRSACCELRVSEIWRFSELKRARTFTGREAAGSFIVTARFLWNLHRTRFPRQLQGDFRWKSHAMQPGPELGWDRNRRWRKSLKSLKGRESPVLPPLPPNPNRGAMRSKILGLPADWRQTVHVERWIQARLKPGTSQPPNILNSRKYDGLIRRHFLVCPGKKLNVHPPIWRPDPERVKPTRRQRQWWSLDRDPWSLPCTGRAYKLFLPLCTRQEYDDALRAHDWLRLVDSLRRKTRRIPPYYTHDELLLINRYGPLFPPRTLLCQRCWGLKYGKVKRPNRFPEPTTE